VVSIDVDGDDCNDLVGIGADLALVRGTCTVEPLPVLPLGEVWSTLSLEVRDTVTVQLADPLDPGASFTKTAGPSNATLTPDGVLNFTAGPSQEGVWRMAIRVQSGEDDRFTGVVLRVTNPNKVVVPAPKVNIAPFERSPPTGPFAVRQCFVSVGIEAGLSANRRTEWSAVGLPDTVPSGSPAVAVSCSGGGKKVRWFFGVDSAPAFFYLGSTGRMAHLLGTTLGVELHTPTVRVGPLVNGGLLLFGVGARAQILPFQTKRGARHGVEVRAMVYPPNVAASVMLGYALEFGLSGSVEEKR
jgi:hypothetical protein